jgi:hypothetical protein
MPQVSCAACRAAWETKPNPELQELLLTIKAYLRANNNMSRPISLKMPYPWLLAEAKRTKRQLIAKIKELDPEFEWPPKKP